MQVLSFSGLSLASNEARQPQKPLFEGCGEAAIQAIVNTGLKSFVTSTRKHRIVLNTSVAVGTRHLRKSVTARFTASAF